MVEKLGVLMPVTVLDKTCAGLMGASCHAMVLLQMLCIVSSLLFLIQLVTHLVAIATSTTALILALHLPEND